MRIFFHPAFLEHRQRDAFHPECPGRLEAVCARLAAEGLWEDLAEPEPAEREDLLAVHDEAYLERLAAFRGSWDPDTWVGDETWNAAQLAAGAAIAAAEHAAGGGGPALALVRPPGHHATASSAMGFCYLNNIAIAAQWLIRGGMERVAILDVDVHHGNGTNEAFHARRDVLTISLHQYPHYPGTGALGDVGSGEGEGYSLNVPLPPGCGDATYADAMERLIEPVLGAYAPEMILVSLGTDAHYRDPLGAMTLSTPGYLDLLGRAEAVAGRICGGRIAYMLEGGYDVEALADVLAGLVGRARGKKVSALFRENRDIAGAGISVVNAVIERMRPFGPVLGEG